MENLDILENATVMCAHPDKHKECSGCAMRGHIFWRDIKVGDTLHMNMVSRRVAVMKVIQMERCKDPPDLQFVVAELLRFEGSASSPRA